MLPTNRELSIPCSHFLVLLLRRLRLSLQLARRACRRRRARRPAFTRSRATCRVLAARASARACCGKRVPHVVRNVHLADMKTDVPVLNERRIDFVANGLPLWHGAQLAVDAIIVSPATGSGDARPGADTEPGRAVHAAARRKCRQTYPELERSSRCRLVVVADEVGGRLGAEAAEFLRLPARHRAESTPAVLRLVARAALLFWWDVDCACNTGDWPVSKRPAVVCRFFGLALLPLPLPLSSTALIGQSCAPSHASPCCLSPPTAPSDCDSHARCTCLHRRVSFPNRLVAILSMCQYASDFRSLPTLGDRTPSHARGGRA